MLIKTKVIVTLKVKQRWS